MTGLIKMKMILPVVMALFFVQAPLLLKPGSAHALPATGRMLQHSGISGDGIFMKHLLLIHIPAQETPG
ncbi:MAG: hypothetical protein C4538_13000 [Nitrospiraceae bacterium]|nr:MAG: hypothetical protein C4538_13000 [Nitrospiraceae bacterium]